MDQLVRNLVVLVFMMAACSPIVHSQPSKAPLSNKAKPVSLISREKQREDRELIEEFSFLIKDFKVDHQAESNNLNISISYRYIINIANSDYPDFRLLAKDVESFLTNYPNEDDYWEVVNKQLTSFLLKKYSTVRNITSQLTADPT